MLEDGPSAPRAVRALAHLEELRGNIGDALSYYRRAVGEQPDDWKAIGHYSHLLAANQRILESEQELKVAIDRWPRAVELRVRLCHLLLGQGRKGEALAAARAGLMVIPNEQQLRAIESQLEGQQTSAMDNVTPAPAESRVSFDYLGIIRRFHEFLRPERYLEIGTLSGASLLLAQCNAIAVDPTFNLQHNVFPGKGACLFFQMTSDAFFSRWNPVTLLGGPIDLSFLDGMHLSEYLLRDFCNVEKYCKKSSVVLLHDCLPTLAAMASRTILPNAAWTGDVWKVPIILRKYRPDLQIQVIDAPPTGLVACTNLNPSSRVLEERMFYIMEEMRAMTLDDDGVANLRTAMSVVDPSVISSPELIGHL